MFPCQNDPRKIISLSTRTKDYLSYCALHVLLIVALVLKSVNFPFFIIFTIHSPPVCVEPFRRTDRGTDQSPTVRFLLAPLYSSSPPIPISVGRSVAALLNQLTDWADMKSLLSWWTEAPTDRRFFPVVRWSGGRSVGASIHQDNKIFMVAQSVIWFRRTATDRPTEIGMGGEEE